MILRLFIIAENHLRMENILYAFWGMFWTLNGLDKFFNGVMKSTDFGMAPFGWFGVNRDAKMIHYFDRLGLPEELALASLYGIAIFEVLIGITFFVILLKKSMPAFIQRLTFKCSMLVFFAFCTGDILFGDRTELWEHGTFMILTLVTFKMFLESPRLRREIVGQRFKEFDINADGKICEIEYDQYFETIKEESRED